MKTICKLLFAFSLGLAIAGCAKYDDTELRGKVDNLTSEVNTLKANQQAMQAVIDVWKAGGYVASIDDSVPGQHTITFYGDNGKTVVIYDGEDGADGDAFFKDVTSDENGVTFVKQDDTKIFIPFAKAFKLVIENPDAEVEAGANVEFAYKVENANSTTSVDVFAGGNYAAVVDAEASKIVVTAPTPAVNGSVLAWAQNEEGLFSMRKLSFIVKAETEVKTTQEELEAIPGEAGDFVVNVVSNIDIDVETPTVDWVSVAVTKADYKLTLTLAENTTDAPRETEIIVIRKDNGAQVQKIKIVQLVKSAEKVLTVERVWGKYSTSDSYWNAYFGGTASTDRNIAMDDEYIYLPETTGAAKMWKIPLDGTTNPSLVNVEGVTGGTHALSCVRVVPNTSSKVNGGKDFLMACNLTTNSESDALKVYSWNNGTSNAPVSESLTNGRGLRVGDKFSVYGSLQDGALFFRNWNGTDGWGGKGTIFVLRMAWDNVPSGGYFNPRITFSYADNGINAYYPYPGDASNGFIANVSAAGQYASYANSPLNTSPNESGTFTASSGYYDNTAGYNFLEYNGKRYIAYAKNADKGDGRFYILQGETTDSWSDILGSKRKVIYQADIQQDLAYADGDYHEDLAEGVTKTSAHSALDCTARIIGGDLYFAVLKQGVGLSLFKMYLK